MKNLLYLIVMVGSFQTAIAQAPPITHVGPKTTGSLRADITTASTSDGYYTVESNINSIAKYVYLSRYTLDGTKAFTKTLCEQPSCGAAMRLLATTATGEAVLTQQFSLSLITKEGDTRWSKSFDSDEIISVHTGRDNAVYAFLKSRKLIKYNASGDVLWSRPYDEISMAKVTILADGSYLIYGDTRISRYQDDGSQVWQKPQTYQNVYALGNTLVAIQNTSLLRLGFDTGDLLWQKAEPAAITHVNIGTDQTLSYLAANTLTKLNPDGSSGWTVELPGGVTQNLLRSLSDGSLLVSNATALKKYSPQGGLLWTKSFFNPSYAGTKVLDGLTELSNGSLAVAVGYFPSFGNYTKQLLVLGRDTADCPTNVGTFASLVVNGCSLNMTATLKNFPLVTIDTTRLSLGLGYNWQKDGVDIPGATQASYVGATGSNYRLKLSQGSCVAYSEPVVAPARIMPSLSKNFLCTNETTLLRVTDPGVGITAGNGIISWAKDGAVLENATKDTLRASAPGIYTYQLKLSDCTVSSAVYEVKPAPVLQLTANGDKEFCQGKSTVLTAASSLPDAAAYRWLKDGAVVGTEKTLEVKNAGTYTLELPASDKNCLTSAIPVTVTQKVVTSAISPATPIRVYEPETVTLTATPATGNTYQWLKDGVKVPGETNATLVAKQPGLYTLETTNGQCAALSAAVQVSIEKPLGIEEAASVEISLYPNPTQEFLQIDISAGQEVGEIILYSIDGRQINQFPAIKRGQLLDIRHLPRTLYHIKITTSKGQIIKKLLLE